MTQEKNTGEKTALIVGYTGECGKELLKALNNENLFKKVILLGRRKVELPYVTDTFEQKVVDFDKLDEYKDEFINCSVGFCCLGTTRSKAGKEGFRKVDHDYVMNIANIAKEKGCEEFHVISSTGANANSWILYNQVKGQVEEELKLLGFKHLLIYRPGLLLSNREENRPGERIAKAVMSPFAALCPTYFTMPTVILAKAMINNARRSLNEPFHIYGNRDIHTLAKNI